MKRTLPRKPEESRVELTLTLYEHFARLGWNQEEILKYLISHFTTLDLKLMVETIAKRRV